MARLAPIVVVRRFGRLRRQLQYGLGICGMKAQLTGGTL